MVLPHRQSGIQGWQWDDGARCDSVGAPSSYCSS